MDLNGSPPINGEVPRHPLRGIPLKYTFHVDGTLGWNATMPYCGRWSAHPNPWHGSKHRNVDMNDLHSPTQQMHTMYNYKHTYIYICINYHHNNIHIYIPNIILYLLQVPNSEKASWMVKECKCDDWKTKHMCDFGKAIPNPIHPTRSPVPRLRDCSAPSQGNAS